MLILPATAAFWLLNAAASAAASAPHRPSKLVVCDDVADPATLDPQREFSEKNHTIVQQIFEGLVRFDPDGKIVPALATNWRPMNDHTVRFQLRKGVVFQNGEPFDAESVRYSVSRYLDPGMNFPARGFIDPIDRVVAIDDHTVDIVTKRHDSLLLNRLAGFIVMVPPKHYSSHTESFLKTHPIGTGPFKFVRWDTGKDIVLTAFERYWDPGLPRLKTLEFDFLPPREQMAALFTGKVDILTDLPGTATLQVMRHAGTTAVKKRSYYTVAATINTSSAPLSSLAFRRALNYAIDRDQLIRYDANGNGVALGSLAMPGETGYDPSIAPYPFDLGKAERLMRQTGFRRPVKLRGFASSQAARTARIIAKQWEEIGVHLELHVFPESRLMNEIHGGHWDIGFGFLPDPIVHASFIQGLLLYSKSPYSLFHSEDYDRRYESWTSAATPSADEKEGAALDRYVHSNALSIFTYQRVRTYGMRAGIRFVPSVTGMDSFRAASWRTEKP